MNRERSVLLARELVEGGVAGGAVVLSTCARTEIYAEGSSPERLSRALAPRCPSLLGQLSVTSGVDALEHLFAVASGADSPVFGDADLLGQVRQAYLDARQAGVVGPRLARVFERSLCTARNIRSRLAIGARDASVGARAVELARRELGGLKGRQVYVLGAGVVAQAVLSALHSDGAECAVVATKTYERACALAAVQGCRALRFSEFYPELSRAGLVFGTSASPHYLLDEKTFREHNGGQPILLIDLAVPRDMDPAIAGLPGVQLRTVDCIRSDEAHEVREQARQMASQKARSFWMREGYAS